MSDPVRDDDDRSGDRETPTSKKSRLSSPRADAFGRGRQFRWTEIGDPFDKGKYWEIYSGTD
jgi:hypothetical protein